MTGQDLRYTAIVGKPSEITFRFAEHALAKVAQEMHQPSPRTLYMIGFVNLSKLLLQNFSHNFFFGGGTNFWAVAYGTQNSLLCLDGHLPFLAACCV